MRLNQTFPLGRRLKIKAGPKEKAEKESGSETHVTTSVVE
jgi:hypothetical protein